MADALDILVVSQFFSPEMGAPAARFHDFGRLLVERGHRVRIITGFPNSPSGIVADGYRRRLAQREWIDGIEVLRGWLYASPRLTRLTKSLGFGTFALSASMRAVLGRPKADVVIATSPPPTVGIPGMLAARLLGAPLVFDVRDIWPEAIAASGRLQSGLLIRFLESIERAIYRNAEAVTVVTEGKRARLIEKGVPEDKVTVIPNGVDLSRFEELTVDRDQLLAGYGLEPSAFIVLYAGIFNPAQGLDVLLDAAKSLRRTRASTARPVQFALVGGGSQRERLSQRITEEELHPGVVLVPEQPRENIPPLLCAANAIAVTLRKRRDTHTIPSKIYESMASGRPVLASADGALAEIVNASHAGIATPAEDAEALAAAITRLCDDPSHAEELGRRGRDHAATHDRRVLVDRFEEVLQRAASGSGSCE